MADRDHLFVYGSLRSDLRHRGLDPVALRRRLAASAERRGHARFQARLYDLGRYPGAVLSPDPAHAVVGELYALDPNARRTLLAELDRFEGCGPGARDPEFRRERVRVTLPDGAAQPSWAYLYCRDVSRLRIVTSGDYAHVSIE